MSKNIPLFKSKSVLYIDTNVKGRINVLKILRNLFQQIILSSNIKDIISVYKYNLPDLIIISLKSHDIDMDAIRQIKLLRQYDYHIPIIVLSDYTQEKILLEIANLAIDAYLSKPLDKKLLIESIHKSIKRNSQEELIRLSEHLIFNSATKELYLNDSIVTLGVKELKLLSLFIQNRSRTITKEEIEETLWPLDSVSDSTLKKLIFRIRKKIDTDIIVTVRGVGYRLNIDKNLAYTKMPKSA